MRDVALVTGASGGIGEDLARLLAAGGADVVLLARSADKLQSLAGELARAHNVSALVLSADLSAPDAADTVARTLADRKQTIDILINNAGFGTHGPFAREDPRELERMLNVAWRAHDANAHVLPGMLSAVAGAFSTSPRPPHFSQAR